MNSYILTEDIEGGSGNYVDVMDAGDIKGCMVSWGLL